MSEPEKPKRRWFQFHLSTAIVLMLVIGGLLLINTRSTEVINGQSVQDANGEIDVVWGTERYGWPFVAVDSEIIRMSESGVIHTCKRFGVDRVGYIKICQARDDIVRDTGTNGMTLVRYRVIMGFAIANNAAVGLGLSFLSCFFAEWIARRREGRKP